jgi:hypothetical protein
VSRAWRSEGSASIRITAPPGVIYDRIADVTATGGRSLECRAAYWLPGQPPGQAGSRFRGRNRSGRLIRWSRTCEVIDARPGTCFAFRTVPERWDPSRTDSTIWRYTLTPDGHDTLVIHDYRVVKPPPAFFTMIYLRLLPHHRDMRPHLQYTLEALRRELGPPAAARASHGAQPRGTVTASGEELRPDGASRLARTIFY